MAEETLNQSESTTDGSGAAHTTADKQASIGVDIIKLMGYREAYIKLRDDLSSAIEDLDDSILELKDKIGSLE